MGHFIKQKCYRLAHHCCRLLCESVVENRIGDFLRRRFPYQCQYTTTVIFSSFFRATSFVTGARKAVSITQPSMGGDLSSMGLTNHSYQSYVSSKVQPANTQHLSVISAPAPVLQRPDLPPSRKLASLENALRGARHPTRRTVKLKTLESGPNALVYS